jgi:hypothetical protein
MLHRYVKKSGSAWQKWLIPVILATWEAKPGRITVSGQPWQIVHEPPISKKNNNQSKMD